MIGDSKKDLVVLVPDSNTESAVRGILSRPQALGIRDGISFEVFKHPRHDPGVFAEAPGFLRPLQNFYDYALVMLDREGSGQERLSARQIEADIQRRLDSSGWKGRSAVVVLDPELEIWVFSDSPEVIKIVADGDRELYRRILNSVPKTHLHKPERPKEVLEEILKKKHIARSSALYGQLAERVSFARCQDTSFNRFKSILQGWFPRR